MTGRPFQRDVVAQQVADTLHSGVLGVVTVDVTDGFAILIVVIIQTDRMVEDVDFLRPVGLP